MRVDQAFRKAGFEILDAKKDEHGNFVFNVRVPLQNPIVPARWSTMMETILVVAESVSKKAVEKWSIDISKRFFARNGGVRYLWRITMSGDLVSCSAALVQATLNSLRTGNELTSVPLIGGTTSIPDPKSGKFKGAYPRGEGDLGSQVVAGAFTVGTG